MRPSRVLLVDVEPSLARALGEALDGCEVIERRSEDTSPEECDAFGPAVIGVGGTGAQAYVARLRAACGRFLPIVAIGVDVLGADRNVGLTPYEVVDAVRHALP